MSRETNRADLVIVGSGPAAMAAAVTYSRHVDPSRRILVLDELTTLGGQIWREGPTNRVAKYWMDGMTLPNIHRLKGQVLDVLADRPGVVFQSPEGETQNCLGDDLILATGARERWIPFPGWTLPGVVGMGGFQAMLKTGLAIDHKRVVIAGSGPLMYPVSRSVQKANGQLLFLGEQASIAKLAYFAAHLPAYPEKAIEAVGYFAKLWNVPTRLGTWVQKAGGDRRLEWVQLSNGTKSWRLDCDYLATGCHLIPNIDLARLAGCAIAKDRVQIDPLCQSSRPHLYAIGECTGVGGAERAIAQGIVAGLAAARQTGLAQHHSAALPRWERFVQLLDATFSPRSELLTQIEEDTIVCRCEDIPHGRIKPMSCWREAKLQTRLGMGPCQGKVCGPAANALYGFEPDISRPPLSPLSIQSLLQLYQSEINES